MGDLAEDFAALRADSKARRANNRSKSADRLNEAGVRYLERSYGSHLIIETPMRIDFWPGTGLWIIRNSNERGRGVDKLLARIKERK